MFRPILTLVFAAWCVLGAAAAPAPSEKIIKVLPHFLDAKGRASITPSLFDRDAYQQTLRENASKRSALRFDVQWRASYFSSLKVRIEARGGRGQEPATVVLEQTVKPGTFSQWTPLTLAGPEYARFGELLAWRATLWHGTNLLAEQKSFLW